MLLSCYLSQDRHWFIGRKFILYSLDLCDRHYFQSAFSTCLTYRFLFLVMQLYWHITNVSSVGPSHNSRHINSSDRLTSVNVHHRQKCIGNSVIYIVFIYSIPQPRAGCDTRSILRGYWLLEFRVSVLLHWLPNLVCLSILHISGLVDGWNKQIQAFLTIISSKWNTNSLIRRLNSGHRLQFLRRLSWRL